MKDAKDCKQSGQVEMCPGRTSSGQHEVRALEAGESTLVGGHTKVLKDEGASQEVQVVDVGDEGR